MATLSETVTELTITTRQTLGHVTDEFNSLHRAVTQNLEASKPIPIATVNNITEAINDIQANVTNMLDEGLSVYTEFVPQSVATEPVNVVSQQALENFIEQTAIEPPPEFSDMPNELEDAPHDQESDAESLSGNEPANTPFDAELPPKKRPKNVLLVCDSLLKPGVFDQEKFGTTFNVTQFKVGSYKQLSQDHNMRKLLAYPQVDAYILALGTNDLRYDYCPNVQKNLAEIVERISSRSQAKIVLSLPPLTRDKGAMYDRIQLFNDRTKDFINRNIEWFEGKLVIQDCSLLNSINSAKDISEVFFDNIHLKRRGTAILCGQIKGALRRAFGFTRTVDRQ